MQRSANVSDPEILEALACSEGLSLAADLLCGRLVVSTDCIATVKHVQGDYIGKSGMIIKEIRRTMKDFEAVQIIHEKRELNEEAHALAKAAVSLDFGRHVWLSERPGITCMPLNIVFE